MRPAQAVAIILALGAAACQRPPEKATDVDALDNDLVASAPAHDPALTSALHDQIMVDPDLVQQSNPDAVRPPPRPASGAVPPTDIAARPEPAEHDQLHSAPAAGPCPQCAAARRALTLGAIAQARGGTTGHCAGALAYSAGWANRLPTGVPLYPDARVTEAAGANGAGCALRVVSFASSALAQRLLDWYFTRASSAGFRVEHGTDSGDHILAGTRSGAAFFAIVHPRPGGTDVDLMADAGQ